MTATRNNKKKRKRRKKKEKGEDVTFIHLAYIAERHLLGGGVEESEPLVLGGELVGVVDAVVAGGAEGGLVCGAKQRRFFSTTDVAVDLHLMDDN